MCHFETCVCGLVDMSEYIHRWCIAQICLTVSLRLRSLSCGFSEKECTQDVLLVVS